MSTDFVLLTCEHGGNRVPTQFRRHFRAHSELLSSHRGYDPGALELARTCRRRLQAPLHFATVTRLLVELNRSTHHRALFSVVSNRLSPEERATILRKYYNPYRTGVERKIDAACRRGRRVIHISLHTFTPVLDGTIRRADVGFLYDPCRKGEERLCGLLKGSLTRRRGDLVVRRNFPYLGRCDGFTTSLRKKWDSSTYLGIEIEVNQRWYFGDRAAWRCLERDLAEVLAESLAHFQTVS